MSADQLRWLFLDLNAYFASVEQQLRPELRGKPVVVTPVPAETACCIAASYEAKAFGIQTGTFIRDARQRCPGLSVVTAREDQYVAFHRRIVTAVESCAPVDAVLSIDEMICPLSGTQRLASQAIRLAQQVKRAIASQVGSCLRASIGLAPNRYLAKLASERQKPDGLTVINLQDLPQALYPLNLRDLPGVGERMEMRLRRRGIQSMRDLLALSPLQLRRIWGGIGGEHLGRWLRGEETLVSPSQRYSIGHSRVLEPTLRSTRLAYPVAKKLLARAAVRLREEGFWVKGLVVGVQFTDQFLWEATAKCVETQSTPTLLKVLDELWREIPQHTPYWISVALHPLVPEAQHMPSLFENDETLSSVVDQVNQRHGKNTLTYASLLGGAGEAPTRISFRRIPRDSEF